MFRLDGRLFLLYYHMLETSAVESSDTTAQLDRSICLKANFARKLRFRRIPEQTAIAEVLSDMDAELAALEQRRDKTRALKQGMMQELLTGRTRSGMKEHQHIEWKEIVAGRIPALDLRLRQCRGRRAGHRPERQGRGRGRAQRRKAAGGSSQQGARCPGHHGGREPASRRRARNLIEIRVEPYPSPISYKGEYHYRSGSTKQELKGAALEQFLLKKRGRHWDGVPEPSFRRSLQRRGAADCSNNVPPQSGRMDRAVLRDSRAVILENLELLEKRYLKRAACLLFSDRPEQYVSGAWIKIGFFVTDDDLRYQDEIHGNLFAQVEKTLELLHTKYLKAFISYEGLHRARDLPVSRRRPARGAAQRRGPQGLRQRHPDPDQRL